MTGTESEVGNFMSDIPFVNTNQDDLPLLHDLVYGTSNVYNHDGVLVLALTLTLALLAQTFGIDGTEWKLCKWRHATKKGTIDFQ